MPLSKWYQSTSEDDKFSSLSVSIDYMGDYNVNGRVNEVASQPNLTNMLSYFHKSGFDISLMYSNIWNSDETNTQPTQELDISLGYTIEINDWLNGMASYSYFTYSKNANSLQSDYKQLFSASVYSEIEWWLADITAGYYSGGPNEFFAGFETGVLIEFENFLKKDNILSIEPMIMANMGNIGYYNVGVYKDFGFVYNYAKDFPNTTAGELIDIIQNPVTNRDQTISDRLKNQASKMDQLNSLPDDTILWNMYKENKSFNLNNIGFSLPVYYYWGDFMINVGFSAFKPVNQPSYVTEEWSGYSNFGVTYFMNW